MTNNNIVAIFLEILQIFLEIVLNIILEEILVRHVGYFFQEGDGYAGGDDTIISPSELPQTSGINPY